MTLGAVTATCLGSYDISNANLLTVLNTMNTGAATAGADINSIFLIPSNDGRQVAIFQLARAGS